MDATMELVPGLIDKLEQCTCSGSTEKPSQALHKLFSLTEGEDHGENRKVLVREENGKFIRVLLDYVRSCEPGSREQLVSLLVLNNVSITSENKHWIAVECGGAKAVSDLLYENPSCHLLVIIMMNLIFADEDVRKEIIKSNSTVDVLGALAFALRESCSCSPQHISFTSVESGGEHQETKELAHHDLCADQISDLHPEMTRWCLLALKNVTRSSEQDDTAAQELCRDGIIPLLLRLVTIQHDSDVSLKEEVLSVCSGLSVYSSDSADPSQMPYTGVTSNVVNDPSTWNPDSIQDAALFVMLNLCSAPSVRQYMIDADAPRVLYLITAHKLDYEGRNSDDQAQLKEILALQHIKAQMALAFVTGTVGHMDETPCHRTVFVSSSSGEPVLAMITESEVEQLVELLANTLHQRPKPGQGGYSENSFCVRNAIHAIRHLLAEPLNQPKFAAAGGARLNALLIKALALYSVMHDPRIDSYAAENACFSLYLQSNNGFRASCLPRVFGYDSEDKERRAAKVLSAYFRMDNCSPCGRHAAGQILRRMPYLVFEGTSVDLECAGQQGPTLFLSDFSFDDNLKTATEALPAICDAVGSEPREDIFWRPVLRAKVPQSGASESLWDHKKSSVRRYSNALHAAASFSFGSVHSRHLDNDIDDIQIANNIASSANGEKTGCYGHLWTWEDRAEDIAMLLDRKNRFSS